MNSYVKTSLIMSFFALSLGTGVTFAKAARSRTPQPAAHESTIEGLVRDVACPIQNPAATATRFNLQCAIECAKNGSPLVILTRKGTMYLPISESMPDKSERARLLPLIGKFVKVTGEVYERGGTHAIAIRRIEVEKNVRLKTDAQ
jgi:hypothetical protein